MVSATVLGNPDAQVWEMMRLAPCKSEPQTQAQIEREVVAQAEVAESRVEPRGETLEMCLL
jgi:hypothetical protein